MAVNYLKFNKETQSFNAGDTVFHQGDEGDFMYGVISGELKVVYNGRVIDVVGEGGFIGEMALVGDHIRSADVLATEDCELAVVDAQRFHWLVHETPTFATQVMGVMAERIRSLHERVAE
ncbi:MAG: Crp/Fnr family transcriptional regulator [Chloroflexota bacterium]